MRESYQTGYLLTMRGKRSNRGPPPGLQKTAGGNLGLFALSPCDSQGKGFAHSRLGRLCGVSYPTGATIMFHVRLNKYRSTWNWFTTNPQGGGFGSNYCGPRYIALA